MFMQMVNTFCREIYQMVNTQLNILQKVLFLPDSSCLSSSSFLTVSDLNFLIADLCTSWLTNESGVTFFMAMQVLLCLLILNFFVSC